MNYIYLFFTFILLNFSPLNYSSLITSLNKEFIFQGDSTSSKNDTINIIAVGDVMMGTNYPNDSYLPLSNGQMLLEDVCNY